MVQIEKALKEKGQVKDKKFGVGLSATSLPADLELGFASLSTKNCRLRQKHVLKECLPTTETMQLMVGLKSTRELPPAS